MNLENCKILDKSTFLYKEVAVETEDEKIYEKLLIDQNEEKYFKKNSKKFPINSKLKLDETLIGAEIIFNKFFYKFKNYNPKKEIIKKIDLLEKQISKIIN